MRDRDDGARVRLQMVLEPRHRLGIEMVGRLVEQQQVRRLQQQAAQRDTPPFAARQRRDVALTRRQPQRVHRHLHLRIEVPGPRGLDPILQLALLVEGLFHLLGRQLLAEPGRDRIVGLEQCTNGRDAFVDVPAHVLVSVQRRLLRKMADGDALGRKRLALHVGVQAGHHPQQRALAGAVQSEHADLGAGQERQPDVVEHDMVGLVHLAQPLHGVDELRHGTSTARPARRK